MANEYDLPQTVQPGTLEVYVGPMNSGKSRELLQRLYPFREQAKIKYFPIDIFKPDVDTRDKNYIRTRAYKGASVRAKFFRAKYPTDILEKMKDGPGLVMIDEAQFVLPELVAPESARLRDVVDELRHRKKHVIVGGLSLDFRGETFGDMGYLALSADIVKHLTAICYCGALATRTQRYNCTASGKVPSNYNDPIVMPGDQEYAAVCHSHHKVPGKPGVDITDKFKK